MMTTIQSIDSNGNPRWTPVPEGHAVERVTEILTWAGHTDLIALEKKARPEGGYCAEAGTVTTSQPLQP